MKTHDDVIEGDINTGSARARWRRRAIDDETQYWLDEDARWFLHQSLSTPCLDVLGHCEGASLENLQGKRYLDFHGNSVHQVGFAHPKVVAAIQAQLQTLSFCTRRYTNIPAIELARRLATVAPDNLNKVLFCPGGAEAVGISLKLARVATGRYKTISLWDSFHGATLDAISVSGERLFRRGMDPLLPGAEHVPPPDSGRCVFGCKGSCTLACADYIEYVMEKEGDIAAVIAEPIRNTTVTEPPAGYWRRVREICDRYRALLIFDEVPTGLGRTGEMFACERSGVVPDILILGKGLGGGLFPMAAVIARDDLDLAGNLALGHYTHEKSPLGAAAGLATLDVIEEEGLVERSRSMGAWALDRIREIQQRHPLVAHVRGAGLLMAIELVRSDGAPAVSEAEEVMYSALGSGLSFKVSAGNVITLNPPLTVTNGEMESALDIIDHSLDKAGAGV